MRSVAYVGLLTAIGLAPILQAAPSERRGVDAVTAPLRYTITLLPLDEANGINERGQVAGASHEHAALWQDGRLQDLGALLLPMFLTDVDPPLSTAVAINYRGLMAINAGRLYRLPSDVGGGFDSHPFLCGYGRMLPLGTFGGDFAEATAINAAGVVVGMAEYATVHDARADAFRTRSRAFLWQNGSMRSLGTLGGEDSRAQGINDAGQVVGWSELRPRTRDPEALPVVRAFLWERGRMRDLGSLPGFEASSAAAINNRAQVVGELSHDHASTLRAFLWEKGRMRDLGTPAGLSSTALAINDHGEIVGYGRSRSIAHRALLWKDGCVYELEQCLPAGSGWSLDEARGINNRGEIVGVGFFHHEQHGFLLTPRKP